MYKKHYTFRLTDLFYTSIIYLSCDWGCDNFVLRKLKDMSIIIVSLLEQPLPSPARST